MTRSDGDISAPAARARAADAGCEGSSSSYFSGGGCPGIRPGGGEPDGRDRGGVLGRSGRRAFRQVAESRPTGDGSESISSGGGGPSDWSESIPPDGETPSDWPESIPPGGGGPSDGSENIPPGGGALSNWPESISPDGETPSDWSESISPCGGELSDWPESISPGGPSLVGPVGEHFARWRNAVRLAGEHSARWPLARRTGRRAFRQVAPRSSDWSESISPGWDAELLAADPASVSGGSA